MKSALTIFILLCLSLDARENPFEAINTAGTAGKVTHKKDTRENFSSTKIQLPSSARILKSVEFHFQNEDASMQSQKIDIDKKIDWHDVLVVKKLSNDTTVKTTSNLVATKKQIDKIKKINFKNLVLFSIDGKSLHVKTKDKKIRDFLVKNPYKIVVDFKREISFYTKIYNLKTKYFKSITLGKHSGYYRIAIELDGKYSYKKTKVKDGYIFEVR